MSIYLQKSLHTSQVPYQGRLILVSPAWSVEKNSVYSSLDGMLVRRRVTPSIKFAGPFFYTWVQRGSVSPRTQHKEPGQSSNLHHSIWSLELC